MYQCAAAALIEAAKVGAVANAKALIAVGASVNAIDANGNTPLHWASRRGDNEMVSFLLRNGADSAIVDADGSTALHLACACGHGTTVELLIEAGADLATVNETGATPRGLAAVGHHEDCLAVIDLLLSMLALLVRCDGISAFFILLIVTIFAVPLGSSGTLRGGALRRCGRRTERRGWWGRSQRRGRQWQHRNGPRRPTWICVGGRHPSRGWC